MKKTKRNRKKKPLVVASTDYGVSRKTPKEVIDTVLDKPFKFHLDMCGIVSESEGKTALEALQTLKAPDKIVNKAVLTISKGDRKKEIFLNVPRLKRLFYPNFMPITIKGLIYGL